ncbi:GMC family oxidoreductase N-terminal domain-containing protein, partial [Bradyrhizobium japonicum]
DKTRARGVAATHRGQDVDFIARKGVILSAGSINSPHLLMLSGIGDPRHLTRHGIIPRVESPEVGQNLMEHPGLYVLAELDVETANALSHPVRGTLALAEDRQTGSSRRAAYCRAGQRRPIAQSVQREWKHRRSGLPAAARPIPMLRPLTVLGLRACDAIP